MHFLINLKVNYQIRPQVLHKLEFQHLFSAMKLEKTFFAILVLKADNVARFLSLCLPYFTVSNLGIKKSEFRKL